MRTKVILLSATCACITTASEEQPKSVMVEISEQLYCAPEQEQAEQLINRLFNIQKTYAGWPDEWDGTQKTPGLYAESLNFALIALNKSLDTYPELQPLVERTMFNWNYCFSYDSDQFYDLTSENNITSRTVADKYGKLDWQGFKQWRFTTKDDDGNAPELLSEPLIGRRAYHIVFNRILYQRCFPHLVTGKLFYENESEKQPFDHSRFALKERLDVYRTYPWKINTQCQTEQPLVVKQQPESAPVAPVFKTRPLSQSPAKISEEVTQIEPKEPDTHIVETQTAETPVEQPVEAVPIEIAKSEPVPVAQKPEEVPLPEPKIEQKEQIAEAPPKPPQVNTEVVETTPAEPSQPPDAPLPEPTIEDTQEPAQVAMKPVKTIEEVKQETLSKAAAVRVFAPNVGYAPVLRDVEEAAPSEQIASADEETKKKFFDFKVSGSQYFNYPLADGSKASVGGSISVSPRSYWSARFSYDYKLDAEDNSFSYSWGFGYSDWHPGTWSLQINNWGPLRNGDGLGIDDAIVALGYSVKSEQLAKRNLSTSFSLSRPVKGDESFATVFQWSPKENWYIRTTFSKPVDGGDITWAFSFGYSDWRPKTLRVEYHNYGPNKPFRSNFKQNGNITASFGW